MTILHKISIQATLRGDEKIYPFLSAKCSVRIYKQNELQAYIFINIFLIQFPYHQKLVLHQ